MKEAAALARDLLEKHVDRQAALNAAAQAAVDAQEAKKLFEVSIWRDVKAILHADS